MWKVFEPFVPMLPAGINQSMSTSAWMCAETGLGFRPRLP